jgi:hypothetical protein
LLLLLFKLVVLPFVLLWRRPSRLVLVQLLLLLPFKLLLVQLMQQLSPFVRSCFCCSCNICCCRSCCSRTRCCCCCSCCGCCCPCYGCCCSFCCCRRSCYTLDSTAAAVLQLTLPFAEREKQDKVFPAIPESLLCSLARCVRET